MNLNQWAIKWGVPFEAVEDLRREFGTVDTDPQSAPAPSNQSEAAVQTLIRLEATRKGCRLWRNNSGAGYDENGNFVRWGLGNDSAKLNAKLKSPDLVGVRPVVITPAHIGQTIGQLLLREVKPRGWRYTGTARETAQRKFLEMGAALGADAAFANDEGTL